MGFLKGLNQTLWPGMQNAIAMNENRNRWAHQMARQEQQDQERRNLLDYQMKVNQANRMAVMNPQYVKQAQSGFQNVAGVPGGYMNAKVAAIQDYADPNVILAVQNYQTPEQKRLSDLKDYEQRLSLQRYYGYGPGDAGVLEYIHGKIPTEEQLLAFQRSKSPQNIINMPGEGKFQEGISGQAAIRYGDMTTQALGVGGTLANIQAARAILESGELDTNALEPAKAQIAAIVDAFGFDPLRIGLDRADTAQAFYAVVMKNLLQELAMQKGPQTEGDAQRAMKTFPQLGNTMAANKFILDYAEAVAIRRQEMVVYVRNRMEELGGNNRRNFEQAEMDWMDRITKVPLFKANPKTGLPVTYYKFKQLGIRKGMKEDEILKKWISEGV